MAHFKQHTRAPLRARNRFGSGSHDLKIVECRLKTNLAPDDRLTSEQEKASQKKCTNSYWKMFFWANYKYVSLSVVIGGNVDEFFERRSFNERSSSSKSGTIVLGNVQSASNMEELFDQIWPTHLPLSPIYVIIHSHFSHLAPCD